MTRSVAEVIGFVPEYSLRDGKAMTARWYTADDLLAWLREQGWDVLPVRDGMGEPRPLTALPVEFVLYKRPLDVHHVEAPTLLAALERAVLAVAGES